MYYYWAIPFSFTFCASLYVAFFKFCGNRAEESCSRVSLFHHVVAMLLGMWTHWQYYEATRIGDDAASFGQNTDFPGAVFLQHFNLGYFLYDTVHVAVWDQRWLLHHCIAISGYATSEIANVFALANAVNTWITELGSLMYSAYLIVRSDRLYLAFVILYTLTRMYFALWSFQVLAHVGGALQGRSRFTFVAWAPYCAASLQLALLVVNFSFVATHWQKLWKRYVKTRNL